MHGDSGKSDVLPGAGHAIVVTPGHVDGAGLVSDPILRHPLVGHPSVSAMTSVHGTAGYQDLVPHTYRHIWGGDMRDYT